MPNKLFMICLEIFDGRLLWK